MKYILPNHHGAAALMMLVIFGMLTVMTGSAVLYAQRQTRSSVVQEQTERAFQVAEAGVHYTLFLLNSGVYNPLELESMPSIEQTIDDHIIDEQAGTYRLTFERVLDAPPGKAVRVISQGRDAGGASCQELVAIIQRLTDQDISYGVVSWDHAAKCQ